MRRRGFSLVEVIIAGVVFFVILMVFQTIFQLSTRGEGRDLRRTQALMLAAEVVEQVAAVHARLRDLPVVDRVIDAQVPASLTLYGSPGGEIQLNSDVPEIPGFVRRLTISVLHEGKEDQLVRPDRAYLVRVTVTYPGPIGEPREEVVSTVRSRTVVFKPRLEAPPWQ